MTSRYPIYIISKGRAQSGLTTKSLSRMKVDHFVAVEPQEYDAYAAAIGSSKLLVLPFSNHGDGPGRARNWCWDHSISLGAKKHWVLDDNITDFYRLHKNTRIRVESDVCFAACEDFADRFENVPIAGLQYRFFIAQDQKYPAYVKNTRIYSCLLIENSCQHRWRGRYNEDVDICLRVLKDGDCTIQFNAFLIGKVATQQMRGGNSDEFYDADGTINKSMALFHQHPDCVEIVSRYGRCHHHVDYSIFEGNRLRLKDEARSIPLGSNEYGLKLVRNFCPE